MSARTGRASGRRRAALALNGWTGSATALTPAAAGCHCERTEHRDCATQVGVGRAAATVAELCAYCRDFVAGHLQPDVIEQKFTAHGQSGRLADGHAAATSPGARTESERG